MLYRFVIKHQTSIHSLPWLRYVSRSYRVLFYGSDDFSLPALKHLENNRSACTNNSGGFITRLEVVCKGKDVPVKRFAEESGLPLHFWPYSIPEGEFDVGVVVSFGHLIPKESISSCLHGMINVHPSLLPRWRGAAPLQHTLINGDDVTGITIIDVAPFRFDVGKVLLQETVPVPPRATLSELSMLLATRGAELLVECLSDLSGYRQREIPQETIGVTKAPKLSQDMGRIQWSNTTPHKVDCLYRGLPFPLFTYWKNRKVKLFSIEDPAVTAQIPFHSLISGMEGRLKPGTCAYSKKDKLLGILTNGTNSLQDTGNESLWVGFRQVRCGSTSTASDFQNGFLSQVPQEEHCFQEQLDT